MSAISAKDILDSYNTGDKERAAEGILFGLITNAEQRKKIIKALRIEMTRKTAVVPARKNDLETLLAVLKNRRHNIIDLLQNNTCIGKKENKEKVAIAIIDYVQSLIEKAIR